MASGLAWATVIVACGLMGCAAAAPVSSSPSANALATPRSPTAFAAALARYDEAKAAGATKEALHALEDGISKIAAQRDAHVSRLYWHTNLDEAKREAVRTNRPILSLRMLGRLDEELSCANSRFFRTTLYSNPEVSTYLRDNFVLHWSSERPVPVMTLDFGDGRRVVRTITGNSIHYVLDAHGRPVDALPGLYEAHAFVTELEMSRSLAAALTHEDDAQRATRLSLYHRVALERAGYAWERLVDRWRGPNMEVVGLPPDTVMTKVDRTTAAMAVNIAATKAILEVPAVRAIAPAPAPTDAQLPFETFPWASFAALAPTRITDAPSLALMRAKSPHDWSTGRPQPVDDIGFEKIRAAFETSLAVDTLKNELGIHRVIHRHFVDRPIETFEALNRFVYGTLFMTPAEDPWLGLIPPRAFSGIPNDGITP